jgi:hypothetical protein
VRGSELELGMLKADESPEGFFWPDILNGLVKRFVNLFPFPEKGSKSRSRLPKTIASVGNHPISDEIFSFEFLI